MQLAVGLFKAACQTDSINIPGAPQADVSAAPRDRVRVRVQVQGG